MELIEDLAEVRWYRLRDGRTVKLELEPMGADAVFAYSADGKEIGCFRFRDESMVPGKWLYLLTYCFLDKQGNSYKRQGIGEAILRFFAEYHEAEICAQDNDGQRRDDGSHLTGDAVGFVARMRKKGLILPEVDPDKDDYGNSEDDDDNFGDDDQ